MPDEAYDAMVGSFTTPEGAQQLAAALDDAGVEATIVQPSPDVWSVSVEAGHLEEARALAARREEEALPDPEG